MPSSVQRDTLRPSSRRELFWALNSLALQGFGGVLAITQRELVEKRRWLTQAQFVEDWGIAQIMPGPNIVNLAMMLGGRYFGWSGALAALAGILLFPILIVLLLAAMFSQVADIPQVQGAMRGLGAVSAGMIAAASLKMLPALREHVLGKALCTTFALSTFTAIAFLHWPLLWVLLVLGSVSIGLTYWQLGKQGAKHLEDEA